MDRPPRSYEPRPPRIRVRAPAVLLVALWAGCAGAGPETGDPAGRRGVDPSKGEAATARVGPPAGAQALSLLGEPLFTPELPDSVRAVREAQLAEARAELEARPTDVDAWIWVGRRQAYLGRYREAISTFTNAIALAPEDPRLYRHRGHRFVTVRELERAIDDLETAGRLIEGTEDEVEPDGLPNPRGIPTSSLHFNIWYHLGLARYLSGDFERALDAYRRCLEVAWNPDALVATSHWLYATLRRLGREAEAARILQPIDAEMEIIENDAYQELLLLYRGEREADALWEEATDDPSGSAIAYGVAAWHLYNGRPERAVEGFRRIVERGSWAAFGHIAAEAELARRPR